MEVFYRMMLKTIVGNLLRRRGYHVFKSDYLDKANLSLDLRNLLTSQKVDCVFDVGANKGQYYSFLREAVRFDGPVISFEPGERLYDLLQKQATADPNWKPRLIDCDCVFVNPDRIWEAQVLRY
jgi:hypothetical protein